MRLLYLLENLLFPPAVTLLAVLLGLLLYRLRWRRTGVALAAGGLLLLYLASLPATSAFLAGFLEIHPPLDQGTCKIETDAQAIVVLAYTRDFEGREYGRPMSSGEEMERLRYAAYLHHCLKLPVVVIGGDALETGVREADLMRDTLENYFGVPVNQSDGRSRHTWDNATYARAILARQGIARILLVTHAWHMRRAARLFETAGFSVQPAPTAYTSFSPIERGGYAWIPGSRALRHNRRLVHELVGLLIQALQGQG